MGGRQDRVLSCLIMTLEKFDSKISAQKLRKQHHRLLSYPCAFAWSYLLRSLSIFCSSIAIVLRNIRLEKHHVQFTSLWGKVLCCHRLRYNNLLERSTFFLLRRIPPTTLLDGIGRTLAEQLTHWLSAPKALFPSNRRMGTSDHAG